MQTALGFHRNPIRDFRTGYPWRDFHTICRVCTMFQVALAVKISLDLLKGYGVMGVLSWWCRVSAKFSAARSGVTIRRTPKSFRGARTCSRSSITMPSLVGLGFHPPPRRLKTLSFLPRLQTWRAIIFSRVCLSVCVCVSLTGTSTLQR